MSFGISIGEFIAVGQLAERLYRDVCLVRHASQELLALQNEVATSNMTINLLIAETKDNTSTLARSGEERVKVVNGVLAETKKTLLELEKFSQNFSGGQRKAGAFGKVKSLLNKAQFVMELSKIDALRARLQHQNGNLNLLLMCAGNSSLQRIETVDQKMNADITKLTKMMAQLTHEAPDDSGLSYKSLLTSTFLVQAENGGRRWFSYGFDEWLRAGQWWLMSSQGRLDPEIPTDLVIPIQPYADLLKASSILLDILPRHPSIRLWDPTKEYLQFQLLADMLQDELKSIETRGLRTPDLQSLQEADLRIWTETVTTVQLRPEAHSVFCQHIEGVQKDHALLHGVILLFIQAYGDVALGKKSLALHQKRRCLEFCNDGGASILHVAESAAQEFSQDIGTFVLNHPPRFVEFKPSTPKSDWDLSSVPDDLRPFAKSQTMFDWAYGILIGPALLGLSLRAFENMSFCSNIKLGAGDSLRYLDDFGGADHDQSRVLVTIAELAAISGATLLIQHLDFNYISINKLRNPVRWSDRSHPLPDNLPCYQDMYYQMSLLHFAVACSPAPAVQILIDSGGDLFKTTIQVQLGFDKQESQVTAVDFAVASENFDSLTLLVKYYSGIDLLQISIYLSRFRGERSFFRARELGDTYAHGFQMLLDVVIRSDTRTAPNGSEMQTFSQKVSTGLFFCALAAKNTMAATILAETLVIDVDELDDEGHTALWHASRLWDVELTEYILSRSSSSTIRLTFQPNENGNTLLHTAMMLGAGTSNMYLANLLALLKSAPDLNILDQNGISLLPGALRYNNYTSAKAIVLAGCKIDGKARLQRLKNLCVNGQLGVFDDTKLLVERTNRDNIEWCRYDPIWDDSDLAGMSPAEIEDYLQSDNYEEQRQAFLNTAAQSNTPSEKASSPQLSPTSKRRRQN
ncbi:hypothetical protein F5882DRAFT_444404 [Hyaloscypha sp. PMI_1271]|nr:hypothetical protein F5882DRAFT_444404 [Hyaloscypha sp. PMI_1271]